MNAESKSKDLQGSAVEEVSIQEKEIELLTLTAENLKKLFPKAKDIKKQISAMLVPNIITPRKTIQS